MRGSEQKKLLSSAIISGGHSSSCSHMSVRLKNPPIQPNIHLLNVTGPQALQLSLPVWTCTQQQAVYLIHLYEVCFRHKLSNLK